MDIFPYVFPHKRGLKKVLTSFISTRLTLPLCDFDILLTASSKLCPPQECWLLLLPSALECSRPPWFGASWLGSGLLCDSGTWPGSILLGSSRKLYPDLLLAPDIPAFFCVTKERKHYVEFKFKSTCAYFLMKYKEIISSSVRTPPMSKNKGSSVSQH